MDSTSLASLATQLTAATLSSKVSTAVALKAKDAQQQQGNAVLQLLEAASSVGQPVQNGLGGTLDVQG